MRYTIQHESRGRIRIRAAASFSEAEKELLEYAFSHIAGVEAVRVFKATGGVELRYRGSRDTVLSKLDAFQYSNVTLLSKDMVTAIDQEEMRIRRLDPALKAKLRRRILFESAADMLLPAPVQLAYHVWQLVTLKNL